MKQNWKPGTLIYPLPAILVSCGSEESEFNLSEYFDMRSELNSVIEGGLEGDMKFRIRDSWYSFGKALNKKLKLD